MKITQQLKGMDHHGLKQKLSELEMELIKENAQIAIGTIPKSPGKIRTMKKTIARIKHFLSQPTKQTTQNPSVEVRPRA